MTFMCHVAATERLDKCVWPPLDPLFLTSCTLCFVPTSSSSYWVVLQEKVCRQPFEMCLNYFLLVRVFQWTRVWLFISKETNQTVVLSLPPCELLVVPALISNACLCKVCHTKVMSSASAHNCLIPLDAKLELFALLQINMGILRRVQMAILI